jgi:hypothetical protein
MTWTADQLDHLRAADELEIAGPAADGTVKRWTPIWLVVVDGRVYVRTWHRRDTGWFGRAVGSHSARVRVPGLEVAVQVAEVGSGDAVLRATVDAAYRSRYLSYGAGAVEPMVADAAADATLRLDPDLTA